MKPSLSFAVAATVAMSRPAIAQDELHAPSAAEATKPGRMLSDRDGHPIGPVYRLAPNGNPQLIVSGHVITVPASTLSLVGQKLTTSLTARELARRK
jgi:hypothetical protein